MTISLFRSRSCDQRWLIALGLGQVLSLCITGTSTASSALWKHYSVSIPFTQNFCNYLLLAVIYGMQRCHADRHPEAGQLSAWRCFGYSFADVQANALAVLAFKSTSMLSTLVLSSWTIPCIMLLSTCCLGTRYRFTHFIAVMLCLAGLAMLIWADTYMEENSTANHSWVGDIICLVSATLYATSNVTEEYLVKNCTTAEFLSRAGLWGSVLCGIQAIIFETKTLISIQWSFSIVMLISAYVLCLFCMYSLIPTLYRLSGAIFLGMSLLTSNFYSLVVGLVFLDAKMPPLYPLAYVLVLMGVTAYNLTPPPVTSIENEYSEEEQPMLKSPLLSPEDAYTPME